MKGTGLVLMASMIATKTRVKKPRQTKSKTTPFQTKSNQRGRSPIYKINARRHNEIADQENRSNISKLIWII